MRFTSFKYSMVAVARSVKPVTGAALAGSGVQASGI